MFPLLVSLPIGRTSVRFVEANASAYPCAGLEQSRFAMPCNEHEGRLDLLVPLGR